MGVRLGLVGRGRWGRNIERTLLSFPNVSVSVIARGQRPLSGLDGVLIATQSATHAQVSLPYIEAGIPTFIEKPMATNISDAEHIGVAAARSGAVVFIGHIYLHHPAFLAAVALLPELGAIRYLHCEGMNQSPRSDCSVLWDWLPHDLSMARAIFGRKPDSVTARSLAGGSRPEAALSIFQFGTASVVSTTSWFSPVARRQTTIQCERATLLFDDKADQQLVLLDKASGERSYPAYSREPPLTRELAAFIQAVRSGKPDASQIESGADIVRAIAAAETSISLGGQEVTLDGSAG